MKPRAVPFGRDQIRYTIIQRPRRRTLGIEVYPNGSVVVLRPPNCADELLEEKLKKRAMWISNQLAHFSQYAGTIASHQYLNGESYQFLGRQYRLRVIGTGKIDKPTVRLARSELLVSVRSQVPMPNLVRRLLKNWYLQMARHHFNSVLDESFRPFYKRGHERPRVFIRHMKRRWGSLSNSGKMTLNAQLIQAPRACIEYVIIHELCHLVHPDHSRKFWYFLDKMMPDWQKRKHRLEASYGIGL